MIPKIIHYCWFGGASTPPELQKCLDTWKTKLSDYTIICWNENNCSFLENDFVKQAYAERKWAFVSDFYRLKALYDVGGIYLDTDVMVHKDFDSLLNHSAFLGFNYDCTVGTAVIGAEPNNKFIGEVLQMYYATKLIEPRQGKYMQWDAPQLLSYGYNTNNYYFTYYMIKKYPKFMLNNSYQEFDCFTIYPKEMFEIGRIIGDYYTIHLNEGSWHKDNMDRNFFKITLKNLIRKNEYIFNVLQILIRTRRYKIANKTLPFYEYSICQMENKPLPDL